MFCRVHLSPASLLQSAKFPPPTHPPHCSRRPGARQQAAGPVAEALGRVGSGGWGPGRMESTCKGGGEAGGEADLAVFLPSQRFTLEKFCDINTSQGTKREVITQAE